MKAGGLILFLGAALVVAGCSRNSVVQSLPTSQQGTPSARPAKAQAFATGMQRVAYKFPGLSTGATPNGPLLALDGVLYGTTATGGPQRSNRAYDGTVYAFDPSTGKHQVLYFFKGGADGSSPSGSLVAMNGILYGTTQTGGRGCADDPGCGTLFSIDPRSGVEHVLHHFSRADGSNPQQGVVVANGLLFGTTLLGGKRNRLCHSGCGTVFSFDPTSGDYTTVHAFSGSPDGSGPRAALLLVNATLYGTTQYGGDLTFCSARFSCGTVFAIDIASRQERVVYSFQGAIDGMTPLAGLTLAGGKLYGTTSDGGSASCEQGYAEVCGTVFSIVPATGEERVVHRFTNYSDGSSPEGALMAKGGLLFGTTPIGGGAGTGAAGTIFTVDMSTRAERVIYRFPTTGEPMKALRGENPSAALVALGGVLYGTTPSGGKYECGFEGEVGCGTIFSIQP